MRLIKISGDTITAVPRDRFNHREKGLQEFVSDHLEDILDILFVKNEMWASLDKNYNEGDWKSQDGRLDTFGVSRSGTPVVIEYKERDAKHMLQQGLAYCALLQMPQNNPQAVINACLEDAIKVSTTYRQRLVLIAEKFSIMDILGHTMVAPNLEVQLKEYALFKDGGDRYFYLYDTPMPTEVIQEMRKAIPYESKYANDPAGKREGFFIDTADGFVVAKKVKNTPIDISKIIKSDAHKIFHNSFLGPVGDIPLVAVDMNGRVSVVEFESITDGIDKVNKLGDKLESLVEAMGGFDSELQHPRLVYIDESPTKRTLERIDRVKRDGNIMISPRTFTVYEANDEQYVVQREIVTLQDFKTHPSKTRVYSYDHYTRNIRDIAVRNEVLPRLRRAIGSLDREVIEGFTTKDAITYSVPEGRFISVEPRNEFLSLKVHVPYDNLTIDAKLAESLGFKSDKDRLRIGSQGDINKAMPIIRQAYDYMRGAGNEKT